MPSFSACCTHEGAEEGITPYRRLHRSKSTEPQGEMSPSPNSHSSTLFLCSDLEPDMEISHSAAAVAQRKKSEHQLLRDELRPASPRIHLHKLTKSSARCFHDRPETKLNVLPSSSQHLNSLGNAEIHVKVLNISRMQYWRNAIKLNYEEDVNTVLVNVAIIGDAGTGKTSFMARYGGIELQTDIEDVALLQKLCKLRYVNIALHIWDLGGQRQYSTKMLAICKDATTIFIMFDLTNRSTLQSVKKWYLSLQEMNKVAMIVLVGTKYDAFVQLPKELQLAIIREARIYAMKMKASLFFSSVVYNINVHKVFKVVVAKLFDLPCRVAQNFTIGKPIVSF